METYLARGTMAGRRPGTLRSWRTILSAFVRAVSPRTLLDVTRGDIEAWISRPELAAASRQVGTPRPITDADLHTSW